MCRWPQDGCTGVSNLHYRGVSCDSVQILLTIVAVHELDIRGADVQNAFLMAPNWVKCWMRNAGPKFGSEEGKLFLVVKALYGLKSTSFSFRSYMAEKLALMEFQSSMADPDVRLRAATKTDGESYYEYVLMYIANILSISGDPRVHTGTNPRHIQVQKRQDLGARILPGHKAPT